MEAGIRVLLGLASFPFPSSHALLRVRAAGGVQGASRRGALAAAAGQPGQLPPGGTWPAGGAVRDPAGAPPAWHPAQHDGAASAPSCAVVDVTQKCVSDEGDAIPYTLSLIGSVRV